MTANKTDNTMTKRISGITIEEENSLRNIALHYGLKRSEVSKTFKLLLDDVVKHKLLDKIEKNGSDDYLGVPLSVVNHLARQQYLNDARGVAKKDKTSDTKEDKTDKGYPKTLKIAKWVIDEIEAGNRITNNLIRDTHKCDYKVAKAVMDAIESNYVLKNKPEEESDS